jgi:hypothetical protein
MFKPNKNKLKLRISLLESQLIKLDKDTDSKVIAVIKSKIYKYNRRINMLETDQILEKAESYGIELPKDKSRWWWDDIDYEGENFRSYLTEAGKAGVKKMIRDERRLTVEWWVKIIVGILAALTGLVGSIIGVLSVLKK